MKLIQKFAVNVRQYRRVGGLTQAQLAEALGLSVEMVGKIERGTSSPSFETIEKLSDVLKVPTAVLFGANADSLPKGPRGDLLKLAGCITVTGAVPHSSTKDQRGI